MSFIRGQSGPLLEEGIEHLKADSNSKGVLEVATVKFGLDESPGLEMYLDFTKCTDAEVKALAYQAARELRFREMAKVSLDRLDVSSPKARLAAHELQCWNFDRLMRQGPATRVLVNLSRVAHL